MAEKSLFSDGIVSEERLLASLERIAMCLEVISGLGRPDEGPPQDLEGLGEPYSAVSYTNDEEEWKKELRRDAYRERTGIQLPPGEEPPKVPAKDFEGDQEK